MSCKSKFVFNTSYRFRHYFCVEFPCFVNSLGLGAYCI